jgi:hypothetical protein
MVDGAEETLGNWYRPEKTLKGFPPKNPNFAIPSPEIWRIQSALARLDFARSMVGRTTKK